MSTKNNKLVSKNDENDEYWNEKDDSLDDLFGKENPKLNNKNDSFYFFHKEERYLFI